MGSEAGGGVYVYKSEYTEPNPYLSNLSDRDIVTKDGRILTLINPAYMIRQVFELAGDDVLQGGHLTSDKLLNPINKPDAWEEKALKAIKAGEQSYSSIDDIDGKPYLRFLRPFMTEEECLKCHLEQGYKIGDVRGGISVKVPLEGGYYDALANSFNSVILFNFFIWFFGVAVLTYVYFKITRLYRKEAKLRHENELILQEMNHRVKNNLQIISSLIDIHISNTSDADLSKALQDIQSRLIAMAHMHDMFVSRGDSMGGISSKEYINRLVSYIQNSYFDTSHKKVLIECDVDDVVLTATQAISTGLVLNELLTNSLKYAFDESISNPEIKISFRLDNDSFYMIYEDNGVGCDIDAIKNKEDSYGLMLIDSMAEKVDGELKYCGKSGFRAELVCNVNNINI